MKFVFSHDSIGVGKNGPTHQPVEILASLRAMPNMLVLRPADAVEAAISSRMSQLPLILRKTLTWDQGHEMINHASIAAATDLDIYFCDPASPWQRGSNENFNKLSRQYFPKGTDLSVYQPDYLDHVERKLNNRPRKTLNWKTPAEALDELLSNPPGVAFTA